jgi:hypothetical protein
MVTLNVVLLAIIIERCVDVALMAIQHLNPIHTLLAVFGMLIKMLQPL